MAAALLVLWLACFTRHASSQSMQRVAGTLEVYDEHVPPAREQTTFFLAQPDPTAAEQTYRSQLLFKKTPEGLVTGDKISVIAKPASARIRTLAVKAGIVAQASQDVLQVQSYQVDQPNPVKNFTYTNGVVRITSITMLANVCGQKSVADVGNFKRQWLNKYNSRAGTEYNTLENYYKECSYGKAMFASEDNEIVDLQDFVIPCHGSWQLMSFSYDQCGIPEQFGWMMAAQAEAIRRGYNVQKYTRRVIVVPGKSCPWKGKGSIGCGDYCFTWLRGEDAMVLSEVFHELGHNLGLLHATTPGVEYGDGSCAMGDCCGDRCFNAAHSWQANWAKPIVVLNHTNLPVGVWSTFTLPATAAKDTNHVQVVPTWLGTTQQPVFTPAYFFSFRLPVGWDKNLLSQYLYGFVVCASRSNYSVLADVFNANYSVSVHVFNGSQVVGPWKTELEGVVSVGGKVDQKAISVILNFVSKTSTTATISVCHYSSRVEANCFDGLDNDCNGLVDHADPACKNASPPLVCNNNGHCDAPRETYQNCPHDCPLFCGDGKCLGAETAKTCPQDCPAVCGDGLCDLARGESAFSCPSDCPASCGDGFCDPRGENAASCKADCKAVCGDGYCDSTRGENADVCAQDCTAVCGDGFCTHNENSMNCRKDCPVRCGDRFCDTSANEQNTCKRDCAGISPTPPPLRSPSPKPSPSPSPHIIPVPSPLTPSPNPAPTPSPTASPPNASPIFIPVPGRALQEDDYLQGVLADPLAQQVMHPDRMLMYTGTCGDGRCWGDKSAAACPEDCPPVCGDGFCDKHRQETTLSCPADCKPAPCGDGLCADSETAQTCPEDCCPMNNVTCGDGVCQAYAGENCLTCPQDCPGSEKEGFCCGAHLTCDLEQCSGSGRHCANSCTP